MKTTPSSEQQYLAQTSQFPNITYKEYKKWISERARQDVASKNRLLISDAYNRTMDYTMGPEQDGNATFTLSFRNPNYEYYVVDGVRDILKQYFQFPITKHELDFAKEHFDEQGTKGGISVFNYERWQDVVIKHKGYPPVTIRAVKDGTLLKPKEPVITVSGPKEIAARYEAKLLRVFYPSIIATHAHMIEQLGIQGRIADSSNRSVINEHMQHSSVRANYIGMGMDKTSNDSASAVYPRTKSVGTLAHRYFASFRTEDEAMENAVRKHDKVALLSDYIKSESGLKKILELKKKYPNKFLPPRLDSGDIIGQAISYLRALQSAGLLNDNEVVQISEVGSMDKLFAIEAAVRKAGFDPKKHIHYGIGGLLAAKDKTRDELSAAYKQTMYKGEEKGKLSDDPDKEPIPGNPTTIISGDKRIIAQLCETLGGDISGIDLMDTVYEKGKLNFYEDDLQEILDARDRVAETGKYIKFDSLLSPLTQRYQKAVKKDLLGQLAE